MTELSDYKRIVSEPEKRKLLERIDKLSTALTDRDAQIERLEKENEELRDTPWPEWATAVLKVIRKHSGYDGYNDALDGVDLPAELEELMSGLEHQAERNLAEARAEREVEQHKASTDHYRLKANEQRARATTAERDLAEARAEVERLRKALEPFAGWTIGGAVADDPAMRAEFPNLTQQIINARAALAKGGADGDA